jgi:hypothetical protein
VTCREAIRKVFEAHPGMHTTNEIIEMVYSRYPDQPWQRNTISAHLIGLSVNHSSSHDYPSFHRACSAVPGIVRDGWRPRLTRGMVSTAGRTPVQCWWVGSPATGE